jgi:hypothetical protein
VNKWVVKTFAVPGDTTGVWPTDNTIGMQLIFTFACGTTYQGVTGWQAGDKRGTVNSTNGGATVSNSFVVTDVGLYLDPDATGVAPKWQMPDYATELAACQRYWYKSPSGAMIISGIATAASQTVYEAINHPTTMRVSPTIAFSSYGNLNISTGMIFHAGDEVTLRVSALPAAAGPFYSSAVYTASARM